VYENLIKIHAIIPRLAAGAAGSVASPGQPACGTDEPEGGGGDWSVGMAWPHVFLREKLAVG